MKLHTTGVKVPKLGTVEDRVIRQYLTKESEKESAKTRLLALLVTNSIPFTDAAKAQEWEGTIKKIWNTYLGLEYGVELPENTEKELQMIEYYNSKVKRLKPKLSKGKDGKLTVTGLEELSE